MFDGNATIAGIAKQIDGIVSNEPRVLVLGLRGTSVRLGKAGTLSLSIRLLSSKETITTYIERLPLGDLRTIV